MEDWAPRAESRDHKQRNINNASTPFSVTGGVFGQTVINVRLLAWHLEGARQWRRCRAMGKANSFHQ